MIKALVATVVLLFGFMAFTSAMIGYFVQPWAPWWIGKHAGGPIVLDGMPSDTTTVDLGILPVAPVLGPHPLVSDRERYELALAAGFSPEEAITATAISIAENGGGDPAALSGVNFDKSRDLGLWQVNSGWWPQFGGHDALIVPINNARTARAIYGRQGWCAWSTYNASCGRGHTGSYAAYLNRARAATLP